MSPVATTLKTLSFSTAITYVNHGGAFVDVRPVPDYLDVHIPGTLSLQYEGGPGFNSRARDCIPLDVPLILLDLGHGDLVHAAAMLRGKGFSVAGKLDDGINEWSVWHGTPASTEVLNQVPQGAVALDVGDPAAKVPDGATRVPVERLWTQARDLKDRPDVAVLAGYGVRAALAVGMLERAGVKNVSFVQTKR